jgi:hypothetical protein
LGNSVYKYIIEIYKILILPLSSLSSGIVDTSSAFSLFGFLGFFLSVWYISAQQSAQVEPVSGTSGVGYKRPPPTTFQQDHTAKKKPKKSNNEKAGDVSTIPEESDESGRIKILYISMMYLYTEFPNFDTNRIL